MKFSEEQKEELAQRVLEYIVEKEMSVSSFAKMSGADKTEMSYIIGLGADGNYYIKRTWNTRKVGKKLQPLSDTTWNKIASSLSISFKEAVWKHFPLLNTNIVTGKLAEIRRKAKTCIIQGHVGTSKSYSADLYKRQAPHYTYIVKGISTSAKTFALRIAKSVNVNDLSGNTYDIVDRVCDKLINESTHVPILIIDEAENIEFSGWKLIKYLYDVLENKCAIAILTANNIVEKLQKKYEKQAATFSQIYSRFNNVVFLPDIALEDVQEVCNEIGIVSKRLQKRIYDISTDFRLLKDNIEELMEAKNKGLELNEATFSQVFSRT